GIANIQNFSSSSNFLDLGDGITIRGRSFEDLRILLKWGDDKLKLLEDDWSQGAFGQHVLMVEQKFPKSPDNFISMSTGLEWAKAQNALMGLRLLKPGEVRIGRMFHSRPASFNVGIGGVSSTGFTVWHPGNAYHLEPAETDDFRRVYGLIQNFHKTFSGNWTNVEVALRSFSSIYDRYLHQAEDCILDAITALEALFGISNELSFRLAFLTATILSRNDDERVNGFQEIKKYYKVRNAIVHGKSLKAEERLAITNDEPLRAHVRRLLVAVLNLIESGAYSSSSHLRENLEDTILHSGRLQDLRQKMRLV
ncbi:MAG TPA: hypothetical protein VK901_04160, partial [Nitrospiraceae bacterium]|nr:hypothetical protein [Nitrospiraceae bacterium]